MKTALSLATAALGLAALPAHAWATQTQPPMHQGMAEIGDDDLAQMRGRWTPPGSTSTVAYFGVTMTSNWGTSGGQQLSSSMNVGMSFDANGQVQVSFQPTVTIVTTTPSTGAPNTGSVNRSIDSSGLGNVSGLVQGVQIAGDGNQASNVATIVVSHEGDGATTPPAGTTYTGQGQSFTAQDGDAMASASIDNQGMRVSLSLAGQGQVQQWINGGSLGQVIALGSDGQSVHNTLQLQLVQRTLASNVNLTRDLAQSLSQIRGIGPSY